MTNIALDLHCTMLMEEYEELLPILKEVQKVVVNKLQDCVAEAGIYVDGVASRIKTADSLAGKLAKKGHKYSSIADITDLMGARIITFYTDDVDKISSLVDKYFIVDWANSVDKRKTHELDSFGYNSLHYICQIPKEMFFDPAHPQINDIKFEIQMRTALQHVWATINHDTGYKTDVEIPKEHLRNLLRLAGMLELADEEFSRIRTEINDYRRMVQNLVADGQFDSVTLDGDSFESYLELKPFDKLNKRIAAINQAEIVPASLEGYMQIFKMFGFKTLGDLDTMIKENSEAAYTLAAHQIGRTDLDILSSSVAIQNLCSVYMVKAGGGMAGLKRMFDIIDGESDFNSERARLVLEDLKSTQI